MTRDEITQSALQTLSNFRYNCYADQDAFRASHTDDEEREAEEDAAAHTNQALNAILALFDQAQGVPVEPSEEAIDLAYDWLVTAIPELRGKLAANIFDQACREAIRGSAARPVSVTGKALEWKIEPDSGGFEHGHWPGLDGLLSYAVFPDPDGRWHAYFDDPDEDELALQSPFSSVEDAKAACQAHFNQLAASIAEVSHD